MGHTVLILRESLPCTTMVWLLSGTGPDNIVGSVESVLESSACFPDRRICCKHALCAWTVSNGHCKICSCANENFRLKSPPVQTSRVFRSVLLHLAGVSRSFKAPSCEKANMKRDTRRFYSEVCGFLMTTSRFLNLGPTQYSAIKKVFLLTWCFLEKSGGRNALNDEKGNEKTNDSPFLNISEREGFCIADECRVAQSVLRCSGTGLQSFTFKSLSPSPRQCREFKSNKESPGTDWLLD